MPDNEHGVRRKFLEEYAETVDQLGAAARSSIEPAVRVALQDFGPDMTDAEWRELREYLTDLLYETRAYYGDAASVAACEFYDAAIAGRRGIQAAGIMEAVSESECSSSVRYLSSLLFNGAVDEFIEKVCDNAEQGVRWCANQTVIANARRDSRLGVKFARVPVGLETCAFCIMLASRGFVYATAQSAGENNHYHAHCDCKFVPGFDGDSIEGYDPDVYLSIYRDHEQVTDSNTIDVQATLRNIRRDYLYPLHKGHINQVKRDYRARLRARRDQRGDGE